MLQLCIDAVINLFEQSRLGYVGLVVESRHMNTYSSENRCFPLLQALSAAVRIAAAMLKRLTDKVIKMAVEEGELYLSPDPDE